MPLMPCNRNAASSVEFSTVPQKFAPLQVRKLYSTSVSTHRLANTVQDTTRAFGQIKEHNHWETAFCAFS
eukprot:1209321-Amphidinium_carterae.1